MLRQLEAKYELFDSVEAMLSPQSMTDILKRNVSQVTFQLFESADGNSGSQIYKVTADDQQFVMKRTNVSVDWLALAFDDPQCRSVRLWQYGVLDRLQPHIDHAIVAASHNGDDYALLMHDMSAGLFQSNYLTIKTVHTLLDALAAMHATFWEDDSLSDPQLGLCDIETMVTAWWPLYHDRYRHITETVDFFSKSWDTLFDMLEPDVRDAIQSLMDNPQPLFERLASYPATLIHGDYRLVNLALLPDTQQLVALDWQVASYAPASFCLSWLLRSLKRREIESDYDGTDYYYRQLAARLGNRFDPGLWQPLLEVGRLAEGLRTMLLTADWAVNAENDDERQRLRQTIDSDNDMVRKGLKWL